MIVMGVDPGLQRCGYSVLRIGDVGEKLLEAGVIRTDTAMDLAGRLEQIAADIKTILDRFGPQVVAVEELYSHYRHPRTAILMGHARGVILLAAAGAGAEVRHFSATRIKKSLTGSGRADKAQIQRAIRATLGLLQLPQPPDVADAIAVALCCANESRSRMDFDDSTDRRNAHTSRGRLRPR